MNSYLQGTTDFDRDSFKCVCVCVFCQPPKRSHAEASLLCFTTGSHALFKSRAEAYYSFISYQHKSLLLSNTLCVDLMKVYEK